MTGAGLPVWIHGLYKAIPAQTIVEVMLRMSRFVMRRMANPVGWGWRKLVSTATIFCMGQSN